MMRLKIESGELVDACAMSAAQTPVKEVWEIAQQFTENETLSVVQQREKLLKLDRSIQLQIDTSGYDDLNLICERLLHLVQTASKED